MKGKQRLLAMIPARLGSQRLRQKNLRTVGGVSLVALAIRRCQEAGRFTEIWVNAAEPVFADIARDENVGFHERPSELANNTSTSEQFVYEFLDAHDCDYLFQVHTIAPLLSVTHIQGFVDTMAKSSFDVMLSVVNEQIECLFEGKPVNFTLDAKTNSQELTPVQRVTWSITGWKATTFTRAYESGACATYAGEIGCFEVDRAAGHIIKTGEDLGLAEAMYSQIQGQGKLLHSGDADG